MADKKLYNLYSKLELLVKKANTTFSSAQVQAQASTLWKDVKRSPDGYKSVVADLEAAISKAKARNVSIWSGLKTAQK